MLVVAGHPLGEHPLQIGALARTWNVPEMQESPGLEAWIGDGQPAALLFGNPTCLAQYPLRSIVDIVDAPNLVVAKKVVALLLGGEVCVAPFYQRALDQTEIATAARYDPALDRLTTQPPRKPADVFRLGDWTFADNQQHPPRLAPRGAPGRPDAGDLVVYLASLIAAPLGAIDKSCACFGLVRGCLRRFRIDP